MKRYFTHLIFTFIYISSFGQNTNEYLVKTTNTEIKKETILKEEKFVKDNFPFFKMPDWKVGMKFMIEPDYLEIDNRLNVKPKKNSSYSKQPFQKNYEFKIFKLIKIKNSNFKSYFTFECEGKKFIHVSPLNLKDLRNSSSFSHIDNFVYLNDIDKAKELLLNKELYILTNRWLKENGANGEYEYLEKFIPVKIIKIGLGERNGPVKMIFRTNEGTEKFLNVRFSGVNSSYSKVFGIDFVDAFSFKNPRDLYPEIPSEMWESIQNCEAKIGMTKKEAELAWGKAESINKTINNNSVNEQWVYGTGSYLYFKNGKLTDIQN